MSEYDRRESSSQNQEEVRSRYYQCQETRRQIRLQLADSNWTERQVSYYTPR